MRRFQTPMTVISAVLLLGACGGGGEGETDEGSTVVTVSVVPSIDAASLYVGEQQGFFDEEGIDLEFVDAGSGPASVAAVVGRTADFGLAANVAIVQSRSNNIPIVAAAPAAGTGDDPAASKDQVVVPQDSDVESFADLEGKTVAVVAVRNSPELFVSDLIDQDGGDSSATEFIEIPFPEMRAALSSGRVDAVAINEPFLSGALSDGGRPIGSYIDDVLGPDTAYTYWFTSDAYASDNSETVQAFAKAMEATGAYADEHPDEVRAAVVENLGIDEAVADSLNLPRFGNPVDAPSFDAVADLMVQYGLLESKPNLDEAIFTP